MSLCSTKEKPGKASPAVSLWGYFTVLHFSDQKPEFHFGEIVEMASSQPNQVEIQTRMLARLYDCPEANGCLIMGSDVPVKAGTCGNKYYPILAIVCGKDEYQTDP